MANGGHQESRELVALSSSSLTREDLRMGDGIMQPDRRLTWGSSPEKEGSSGRLGIWYLSIAVSCDSDRYCSTCGKVWCVCSGCSLGRDARSAGFQGKFRVGTINLG